MPPSKASRATAAHDDPEPKAANSKEKNGHGHGHGHGHANGKMRRVASSTGSNLKDVTNAANLPEPVAEQAASSAPAPNPTVSSPRAQSAASAYVRSIRLIFSLIAIASRFHGTRSIETFYTVTAANTTSPHRPPTPATTVPGSLHSLGASGSSHLQYQRKGNLDVRRNIN